jgi:hypothetical protein
MAMGPLNVKYVRLSAGCANAVVAVTTAIATPAQIDRTNVCWGISLLLASFLSWLEHARQGNESAKTATNERLC